MIKSLLLQIIILAYAATGIVGVLAYWPTIKDLYHHKLASANIVSYVLWTSTGLISLLYSVLIIHDLLLNIVTGLHFVACLIVLLLSIGLRNKQN